MSLEVAQEKSNELDIDDGTIPIEDAAQTENAEETAQIDDDGDVDGSQVSEVETADDAETDDAEQTDDKAEGATEETPEVEKTEEPAAEAPKPEASDYTKAIDQFREEFGETAAKPFEQLAKRTERLEAALSQVLSERDETAKRSDQQVAAQHMTAAGIDAKKHADVYQDAVDYFEIRKKQGRAISGMDALKWAIRSAGGNADKPVAPKATAASEKAAKLQGLRSIPPKSRQSAPDLDLNDPAVADGTAPVGASR